MTMTVGELSTLAGVTIRTLHHYDELGLVRPSRRSGSGYREYTDDDVRRLQTVLFYRELGFDLDRIRRLLDDPGFDRTSALRDQHQMLVAEGARISRMARAVEAALEAETKGVMMSAEEMLSPFGEFDPAEYEAEARERWGETEAYRESARRTGAYSDDDWREVMAEAEGIADAFAAIKRSGVAPADPRAVAIAERHRRHIDERFYRCTKEMHRNLGEMYVSDLRFAAYWDEREPGLAQFVRDAIAAND